jgi:hypothetical protein
VALEAGDKIGYQDERDVEMTAYVVLVQWPYCYAERKHTDSAVTLLWDSVAGVWREHTG